MSIRILLGFTALAFATGCAGGDATGPNANSRAAIPVFKVQGACQEWSCVSGTCGDDTAIYGACCISVNEYASPVPKPSCSSPETTIYCQTYPKRCTAGGGSTDSLVPSYCYYASPTDICAAKNGVSVTDPSCAGSMLYDYPECYPGGAL